ncbi:alpha/beta hydrolase [Chryseomicrobium palamuruense]|uniref:Alpha/beta hydrolase n=1 Tax=Chryseomicrobium palamuruense TaxID=682973 RepID=A0ABV8UUW5_9BACL
MRKRVIIWTSVVTSLLTALTTLLGFVATNRLMYIKRKETDFILNREISEKRLDQAWYDAIKKEDVWIESKNGYQLKSIFIQPHDTKNYVIICHGVTENKVNSLRFVRMFERLGFNSVIYDHRRHGDSGGKTTSFGYYEKMDLESVVDALRDRVGEGGVIGIHGESMGAATTLLYAGSIRDDADFYISDCAFSDFEKQVHHVMMQTIPIKSMLTVRLANMFMKLRDGYTFRMVSPIDVVDQIEKPVLFIHSWPDEFILPYMAQELYDKKQGAKELKMFDKGAHAKSINENPEEYEETVHDFLTKYDLFAK